MQINIFNESFIATVRKNHLRNVGWRVAVKASPSLSQDEIKSIVSAVFERQQKDAKATNEILSPTLTINSATKSQNSYVINYEINRQSATISIPLNADGSNINVDLRPLHSFRPQHVPEMPSFMNHWRELCNQSPIQLAPIRFLWQIFICPLLALYRTLTQLSPQAHHTKQELAALQQIQQSPDIYALITSLEKTIDLLERQKSALSAQESLLLEQLHTTVDLCRSAAAAAATHSSLETWAHAAAEKITSSLQANTPLCIAGGYFIKDTFHPTLLTFYSKSGRLYMEKMTTDPQARENQSSSRIAYEFENSAQLPRLLEIFGMQFSRSPSTKLTDAAAERLRISAQYFGRSNDDFMENVPEPSSFTQQLDSLITSCGGKITFEEQMEVKYEAERKEGFKRKAPKDLLEISRQWAQNQFPDASWSDKILFRMDMLQYHLEIATNPAATPESKSSVAYGIKHELAKFRYLINKRFGHENAFEQLSETIPEFTALAGKIALFEDQLAAAEHAIPQPSFQRTMDATANSAICCTAVAQEPMQAAQPAPSENLNKVLDHPRILKSLERAISERDAILAWGSFEQLVMDLDTLTTENRWEQALRFGSQILDLMPPPSAGRNSFWDCVPQEHLDRWGEQLTLVAECIWDARMHLGLNHLDTRQLINFYTVIAILYRIQQRESEGLRAELLQACQAKGEAFVKRYDELITLWLRRTKKIRNVQTVNQLNKLSGKLVELKTLMHEVGLDPRRCSTFVFDGHCPHYDYLDQLVQWERYFPEIDPHHVFKLHQLKEFFKRREVDDDRPFQIDLIELSHSFYLGDNSINLGGYEHRIQLRYQALVSNSYIHEGNHTQTNNELLLQLYAIISRKQNQENQPFLLPNNIIDQRRLSVMFNCLFRPEMNLIPAVPINSTSLLATQSNQQAKKYQAIEQAPTRAHANLKLAEMLLDDVQSRVRLMGRLEISTRASYVGIPGTPLKKYFGFIHIVPRNGAENSEAREGLYLAKNLMSEYKQVKFPIDYCSDYPNQYRHDPERHSVSIGRVPREFLYSMTAPITLSKEQVVNHYEGRWNQKFDIGLYPYAHSTEVDALSDALSQKKRAPMDHYLLKTLTTQRFKMHGPHSHYSIRHLSPSPFSFIDALNVLCQSPHLLDTEESQRLVELQLLHPQYLYQMLTVHPEAIVSRLGVMKTNIHQALFTNNIYIAAFLMHIQERIKRCADGLLLESQEISLNREALEQIVKEAASYDSSYTAHAQQYGSKGWELLLQIAMEPHQTPEKQKFLMVHVLDWFHLSNRDHCRIDSIHEHILGDLLFGYALLKNSRNDGVGIPLLREGILDWMQYVFLPLLISSRDLEVALQSMLNGFSSRMTHQTIVERWTQSTDNKFIFSCSSCTVDLRKGAVVGRHEQQEPIETTIPAEIADSPAYQAIFGNERLTAQLSFNESRHQSEYLLQLPNAAQFRLTYDQQTKQLFIDQQMPPRVTGSDTPRWYRWHAVENANSSTEKLIQHYGIWKSVDTDQKIVVFSHPREQKLEHFFRFDNQLISIQSSLIVCQDDATGSYSSWFPFVASKQLLILRHPDSTVPTQIHILAYDITLRRQIDSSWTIMEGDHKRFQLQTDLTSSNMQSLIKELGTWFSQSVLPLKNGSEERFVIFPNFVEKGEMMCVQHTTSFVMTIDKEGLTRSSPACYLYLAYLLQAKGSYALACDYLKMATEATARLTQKEDWLHIEQIAEKIRIIPAFTLRQHAFHLRTELAVFKMYRLMMSRLTYSPMQVEAFVQESTRLAALYADYQYRKNKSMHQNPQEFLQEDLALNRAEEEEFAQISKEALHQLASRLSCVPEKSSKATSLSLDRVDKPDLFERLLLVLMVPETEIPLESIDHIGEIHQNNLLKHFLHYYNQIRTKRMTPEDLKNLFTAKLRPSCEEGSLASVVDRCVLHARYVLMSLAASNLPNAEQHEPSRFLTIEECITRLNDFSQLALPDIAAGGVLVIARALKGAWHARTISEATEALQLVLGQARCYAHNKISLPQAIPPSGSSSAIFNHETLLTAVDQARRNQEISFDEARLLTSEIRTMPTETVKAIQTEYEQLALSGKPSSILPLVTALGDSGKDLIESIRLRTVHRRIDARLQALKAPPVPRIYSAIALQGNDLSPITAILQSWQELSPQVKAEKCENIQRLKSLISPPKIDEREETPLSQMKKTESEKAARGATKAAEFLNREIANYRHLSTEAARQQAYQRITDYIRLEVQTKRDQLHTSLLNWAGSVNAPKPIRDLLRKKAEDGVVLDQLLKLYQKGRLTSYGHEDSTAAATITQFLLISTQLQQLHKALVRLEQLPAIEDPDAKADASNEIYHLIAAGCTLGRYNFSSPEAQRISRKLLVAEYCKEIILRPGQVETIRLFVEDPNRIIKLPPGWGKTTILPIIMLLLAESMLPIALVTEELLQMHRESLDSSSRLISHQAAMQFDFDVNCPDSAAYVAEIFDQLLQVKQEEGYVIGTIERKAAVENKLTLVADKINDILEKLKEQPKSPELMQKLLQLHKVKVELIRLKALLDGTTDRASLERKLAAIEKERDGTTDPNLKLNLNKQWLDLKTRINLHDEQVELFGFHTQYIADEGDRIFGIRRQINLALAKQMRNPNQSVVDTATSLMCSIMQYKEENYKLSRERSLGIFTLQEALLNGTQASLSESTVKIAMEGIASMAFADLHLSELGIDESAWILYATCQEVHDSRSLGILTQPNFDRHPLFKRISALKMMLGVTTPLGTLPNGLKQQVGMTMGILQANGALVVPCDDGVETRNKFANEPELIINHFLVYLTNGPTTKLIETVMRQRAFTSVQNYREIIEGAAKAGMSFVDFLKHPTQWRYRLEMLNEEVIKGGYLKLAQQQVTLSAQGAIRDCNCGMMSGTGDPENLPEGFNDDTCKQSYFADALTWLKIAMGNQPIVFIPDAKALDFIVDSIKDDHAKTFINQGVAFEGQSTMDVVKQLCANAPHRRVVFVHPDQRKLFGMRHGETALTQVDANEIIPETDFVYYYSTDVVGIDAKRNPKKTDKHFLLTGPTTQRETAVQAANRFRELGKYPLTWVSLESVRVRIDTTQQLTSPPQLVHVLCDVNATTMAEDSVLNYKAAVERIQGFLFTKVRNRIVFANFAARHTLEYWQDQNKVFLDIVLDNYLFSITRDLMIKPKEINFESEIPITKQISVVTKLEEQFQFALKRLADLEKSISTRTLQDYLEQNGCLQSSQTHKIRINTAQKQIAAIAEPLKHGSQNPPNCNSSSTIATTASHNQAVLEQVHQQQLEQQLQVVETQFQPAQYSLSSGYNIPYFGHLLNLRPKLASNHEHSYQNVSEHLGQQSWRYPHPWYDNDTHQYHPHMETLSLPLNLAKHVSGRLFITSEAAHLFEKLGRFPSAPIMRLGIFKTPGVSTYNVCLMSKNDYHYAFCHRDTWLDDLNEGVAREGGVLCLLV